MFIGASLCVLEKGLGCWVSCLRATRIVRAKRLIVESLLGAGNAEAELSEADLGFKAGTYRNVHVVAGTEHPGDCSTGGLPNGADHIDVRYSVGRRDPEPDAQLRKLDGHVVPDGAEAIEGGTPPLLWSRILACTCRQSPNQKYSSPAE